MIYLVYAIFFAAGAVSGILLNKYSIYLIKKRVKECSTYFLVNDKYSKLFWPLFCGTAWLLLTINFGINLWLFECVFVFSTCLVLSAVDFSIRKIPNELVILLTICSIGFILAHSSPDNIMMHLNGFFAGTGIFLIPYLFGKQAGMGDLKYIAVIGFFLGYPNILYALLLMSISLLCYFAYVFIAKKGSLYTYISMGPFISAGFLVAFIMQNAIKYILS